MNVIRVLRAWGLPGPIAAEGAGEIDFGKFCDVMESMGKQLEKADLLRMFQEMDDDDGGTIDADEFAEWYVEEEELQKKNQKREVGAEAGTSVFFLRFSPYGFRQCQCG